jgi:hypothetical protein
MSRSSSTNRVDVSRPTRSPTFDRRIVVSLSTIAKLGWLMPVSSSAGIGSRSSGASTSVVVSGHTVTESVSKRSSCRITAGRGFEAYTPPATSQISPRLVPLDGDRLDEGLIVGLEIGVRDEARLAMRLGGERLGPDVRHPDLHRTQPLLAQALAVCAHTVSDGHGSDVTCNRWLRRASIP